MAFGKTRAPVRTTNPPSPLPKDLGRPADDWLQPLPTTEAQEGGESMWDAWQEESRRMDLAFADTQPSDNIPLTGGSLPAPPAEQSHSDHWSAFNVIAFARRGNRVCPRPLLWSALYLLLEGDRYPDLRPPPQPGIWGTLSNLQRRLQFHEHIEWADRHGKLEVLAKYIASLAEPDWVHMGEA